MSRPEVSVVMPFAGDAAAGRTALESLRALGAAAGDELILVDNSGTMAEAEGVTVVPAPGERSPAHARNVGAMRARRDWILFLDADTRARPGLLDAYFADEVGDDVGALVGEVLAAPGADTLAARYGSARSFLGQQAHLQHAFMPRAAAANLLVRRAAFSQVGGFYEGVRAAEDTDFSWRLQEAGWRLEPRPEAKVEHRYRTTVSELRRQWRGYAAGRAWLARRYEGFEPQPAALRAMHRAAARLRRATRATGSGSPAPLRAAPPGTGGPLQRGQYFALDALLALEELAGLALSNRPADVHRSPGADVVLVADRFPAQGDPLTELAEALDSARVEAVARPEAPDLGAVRRLRIDYLEDDGAAARLAATILLVARHPLRAGFDLARRRPGALPLRALAPAVLRLARDPAARVHPLGGGGQDTARRLARLSARGLVAARSREGDH